MSSKQIKVCVSCYFVTICFLQAIAILYLLNYSQLNPIEKLLNKCGQSYFFSKIIIKGDHYYFQDVSGCDPANKDTLTCLYSVKGANKNNFYNTTHHLDKTTLSYLSKAGKDIHFVDNPQSLVGMRAIDDLLSATINKIQLIWFKVKQGSNGAEEVYIITSINPNKSCNKRVEDVLRSK